MTYQWRWIKARAYPWDNFTSTNAMLQYQNSVLLSMFAFEMKPDWLFVFYKLWKPLLVRLRWCWEESLKLGIWFAANLTRHHAAAHLQSHNSSKHFRKETTLSRHCLYKVKNLIVNKMSIIKTSDTCGTMRMRQVLLPQHQSEGLQLLRGE